MKAMLLTAPGMLEIVDLPDPRIEADDDVIVRVRAASVCGSDTHGYTGQGGRRVPPLVMGHEASGEVAAVGPAVSSVRAGDRVLVMPAISCLACASCVNGAYDACVDRKVYGADLPGSFAEYVRIKERAAIRIPDAVSFVQAALIEPLAVVVKGLARAHITAGDSAAVVGAGPIGLLAVAVLAQHRPRELVVLEPQQPRRELARSLGATLALDARDDDVAEVRRRTDGLGTDVTVEAVGLTASVKTAVDVTRAGGQLVWLGNVGRVVEIDEFKVIWNQLTIHASVGVTRAAMLRSIALIASGAVPVERIVTQEVPLVDGVEAFHRTARDRTIVKTVLLP